MKIASSVAVAVNELHTVCGAIFGCVGTAEAVVALV